MKLSKYLLIGAICILSQGVMARPASPVLSIEGKVVGGGYQGVLSTPSGMTLYVFDLDKQAADKSVCNALCAEKWPPVILSDKEAESVNDYTHQAGVVHGFIARNNGLKQLTINGRPVYTFYLDRTRDDVKGHGLGNVWHTAGSSN